MLCFSIVFNAAGQLGGLQNLTSGEKRAITKKICYFINCALKK